MVINLLLDLVAYHQYQLYNNQYIDSHMAHILHFCNY